MPVHGGLGPGADTGARGLEQTTQLWETQSPLRDPPGGTTCPGEAGQVINPVLSSPVTGL